MQCTLLIPDLWWPHETGEAPPEPALPHLQTLLARARRSSFPAIGAEAWLCQAFEVERQRDWPVAALTLSMDGGAPGNSYWMRADPLHLRPHGDQLIPLPADLLEVSAEEARSLADSLGRHFAIDGLQFHAPHPQRWYMRLETDPGIVTCAPGEPAASASPWLPEGPDSSRWRRICSEIEMLLHDHPVNHAREALGKPAINSVWLWGGGRQAAVTGRHFTSVWSDDILVHALATRSDVPAQSSAAEATTWLQGSVTDQECAHVLVTCMQIARTLRGGDIGAWRARLAERDNLWFAPLLTALARRRVKAVTLVVPGRRQCDRFELKLGDLLRIWRRARPFSAFAPSLTS
jgi:hypothetical protein